MKRPCWIWLTALAALAAMVPVATAADSVLRYARLSVLNSPDESLPVVCQFHSSEGQTLCWESMYEAGGEVAFQVAQVAGKRVLPLPALSFSLPVVASEKWVTVRHKLMLPGDGARPVTHLVRWAGGAVLLKTYPQGLLSSVGKISLLAEASAEMAVLAKVLGEERVMTVREAGGSWSGVGATDDVLHLPADLKKAQLLVVFDSSLPGYAEPVSRACGQGHKVRVPAVWLPALREDPGVQLQLLQVICPTR